MKRKGSSYKIGSNQYEVKRKAKYWRSLAILAILYLLTQIAIFGYQELDARVKVAFASESLVTSNNQVLKKTQAENQQLKDKLDGIFSLTTSDTTKQIVDYYLVKYFGDKADQARQIFTCESGLRPEAVNTHNKNGSTDSGVPQINSIHAKRFANMYGVPLEIGSHDIDLSIQYAKFLYDHSGWAPWVCSKKLGFTQ